MTQAHSSLTRGGTGTIIGSHAMVLGRISVLVTALALTVSHAAPAQTPEVEAILDKAVDYVTA
jgi:hypothetical protein